MNAMTSYAVHGRMRRICRNHQRKDRLLHRARRRPFHRQRRRQHRLVLPLVPQFRRHHFPRPRRQETLHHQPRIQLSVRRRLLRAQRLPRRPRRQTYQPFNLRELQPRNILQAQHGQAMSYLSEDSTSGRSKFLETSFWTSIASTPTLKATVQKAVAARCHRWSLILASRRTRPTQNLMLWQSKVAFLLVQAVLVVHILRNAQRVKVIRRRRRHISIRWT
mmetsp:Transcript_49908/g.83111  ORF Transcript_49908/g.83111 Transcript_49908/m.83111 type:complete len:220 (-) Transcript_49908:912-1571(-)